VNQKFVSNAERKEPRTEHELGIKSPLTADKPLMTLKNRLKKRRRDYVCDLGPIEKVFVPLQMGKETARSEWRNPIQ
jgi:hypothetical protein